MSLTLSNDSKNNLSVINDSRTSDNLTWDDMIGTWDNQTGTWQNPRASLAHDSKNNLSISNEAKN